MVGAFVPFLRELKRRRQPFLVLEQDPATLKADELPFFRPAEQAATVVPQADVLLITGTTLINDTLEELLALGQADGSRDDGRPDCKHVARRVSASRRRYSRHRAHH